MCFATASNVILPQDNSAHHLPEEAQEAFSHLAASKQAQVTEPKTSKINNKINKTKIHKNSKFLCSKK